MSTLAVLLLRSTDEPERAVAALAAAQAAIAIGNGSPVLVLDDEGVRLGAKGVAETISSGGRPDAKEILVTFVRAGGRILVARDAWRQRGFADDALVEGAALAGPETLARLAADGFSIASF